MRGFPRGLEINPGVGGQSEPHPAAGGEQVGTDGGPAFRQQRIDGGVGCGGKRGFAAAAGDLDDKAGGQLLIRL